MRTDFIGDRYIRDASGSWIDLVTGDPVVLTIRPARAAVRPATSAAGDATDTRTHGPPLIDVGIAGKEEWFEARAWRETPALDADDVALSRAFVARIVSAADVVSGSGIRTLRLDLPDRLIRPVKSATADRLQPLGFVTISAEVRVPRVLEHELLHRHMVVFCRIQDERGVDWIRRLSAASPRVHLVVVHGSDAMPGIVRDRGARFGSDRVDACGGGPDVERRCREEGRAAAGFIEAGDLQRAETALAGVEAELVARGVERPVTIRLRQAQLRFWQGRFEEASAYAMASASGAPELVGWRGLIGWARGDQADIDEALTDLAAPARDDDVAACWRDGLDLLRCSATDCDRGMTRRAKKFLERVRGRGGFDGLGPAIAAEALLRAGRSVAARRLLRDLSRHASTRPWRTLDRALCSWLRLRAGDESLVERDAVMQFIRRSGARGFHRWGIGRGGMNVLNGLTALLELVHDADDEHVALKRGCSWVREHAGADAVGIVTNEGSAFVVSDGLGRADLDGADVGAPLRERGERTVADGLHAVVTAPMRYGGVTIGFAVIKGRRDSATTLAEAGTALASACAPALRARLDALALVGAGETQTPEILGSSPSIVALRQMIARAASTGFSVLIEGESGTGKELVARAVHRLSTRRDRRICAINCAALTDDLVEAELFGYVRGAFTGAVSPRTGLFEDAHGGTLFLDEVSELSARGQAKLLRVLQEREIRRLGENMSRPIDVRVIAATNQLLSDVVGRGTFREDLLFRLAVVRIRVPPLRDRIEDVPLLAQAYWRKLAGETGKRVQMGSDAVAALCRYRWPGNVRELQNVIAGLIVAAPTRGRIGARHVAQVLAEGRALADAPDTSLDAARHAFERRMVAAALARHGGRRTRAAVELGISRQGLTKAIKRLGLGGVA